ncbi:autoinducer binding domain-containing protein [Dinoroseobacter sp. PD6]|uniref:helix-turn-helix transcriptional regulator n=1 Tax=Dinoroseobacter sp. PD6 TaxID=3028384 RepID=UPI00237AA5F0|nr:LuxR family transcriptional regulator [Dinoroseobacter sp. PD6]MDD9715343.1 autoinducer binding domain-containing protein [Dinoroseobacter sp. PD6]
MTKDELLAAATSATQVSELWTLMLDYAETQRIARVSYHHHGFDEKWGAAAANPTTLRRAMDDVIVSATPRFHIIAHGFPREWVDIYVDDHLYEIDPIPALAQRRAVPFLWSEIAELTRLAEEQAAFLERSMPARVGDGVAIQVFGPNMRHGYVGMGFGDRPRDVTAPQLAEYQLVSQLMHLRACRLIEERNRSEIALSARETEVLGWMARGKSKTVIADILGLSPHTVDTLVRRIFRKLEVFDRTAAILKAINLGLVPAMSTVGD